VIPGSPTLPVAYITLGSAGSGKSTLSKQISRITGAVYLDKDTLAGPLVQLALEAFDQDPSDRESNKLYVDKIMPIEYETLFGTAGRNLELGHSVVIDAPFVAYLDDPDFLQNSTERAEWPPVRIRVIHVRTSQDIVKQRLAARGNERDRVKLANWDAYWKEFGQLECQWHVGEHVTLWNDDATALDRLRHLLDDDASAKS
jgi:predicted kinase